ncbi:MAG: sensor histidine kinase [Alphaproteobacteria bacterium]
MPIRPIPFVTNALSITKLKIPNRRTFASYERELTQHRILEIRLREALAREGANHLAKDELIERQEMLCRESDHRLLNGLQMVVSLLSLQSRDSTNVDSASQLAVAANRVGTIARVHRRLHSFDGLKTIAFKQYLIDFCREFSAMLNQDGTPQTIRVEGDEVVLPTSIGMPLGFIVNELVTNASKYGSGGIAVSLVSDGGTGYALSVSNDGPPLPNEFDPAASSGLGMRLVRSFVQRIGGELKFGTADERQGAKFTVLFS